MTALLLALAVAAAWGYLALARGGFWRGREDDGPMHRALADAPPGFAWPRITAVVAARNEAELIGTTLRSLLRQRYDGEFEVIVVDDHSQDDTAAIATRTAIECGEAGRLTVVAAPSLPAGWTGKLWALATGLAHVGRTGEPPDYWLFTDADIEFDQDALGALVLSALREARVLSSLMVQLRCESPAERALIPAFVFFFQMIYPFAWVNQASRRTAAAAGGCMLVQRQALADAGGIAAIRNEIIDDCALGRRLKRLGRIHLALGRRVRSLRSCASVGPIRAMVARSAFAQLGYSYSALALVALAMLAVFVAPVVLAGTAHGLARGLGSSAWALMAVLFAPTARRYKVSVLWGLALPAIAAVYLGFTVESALLYWRGRGGVWKGRAQARGQTEADTTLAPLPAVKAEAARADGWWESDYEREDSGADTGPSPLDPATQATLDGVQALSRPSTRQGLKDGITRAAQALFAAQRDDGHWVFELEADATIPAEYVLLTHYLGEPNPALEQRIAVYLRRIRQAGGGWPLHHGGAFNMSASVKAYFALKAVGDRADAPHMVEARETILANGGAEQANVFTRILLALFGVLPWRSIPVTPVEIMFLPRRFPIHLSRISYWSRTVLVPLLVLHALKPLARNPRHVGVAELFLTPPRDVKPPRRASHQSPAWFSFFAVVDALLRRGEPLFPQALRRRAIDKAVAFVRERLNGDSGLGAIFPAMANTVMMLDALGYSRDHPDYVMAWHAIDRLIVARNDEAYCQPCVSPVWDTALVCHALLEVGSAEAVARAGRGLAWLKPRQVLDVEGDWAIGRPGVRPGGWAFQYANPHYPDLDDTAVVVLAMDRYARSPRLPAHGAGGFEEAIARGREWVLGLQSRNGGWGAFEADNTWEYLNHVPFADHGALLDPPTADVTARCIGMLAQLGRGGDTVAMRRGLRFLLGEQRADGSWFGRWGMNYIYGTWSALVALRAAGMAVQAPEFRRAVDWLLSIQDPCGGWGESESSYSLGEDAYRPGRCTASQTAWAVLALMAAGEVHHPAVERGVAYLMKTQQADGFWHEPEFTATGFPRVFYLRYHGYPKFFPLWALARYRRLTGSAPADKVVGL